MINTFTESRWGKEAFVDEIVNVIVRQDGYAKAEYVYDEEHSRELVLIYSLNSHDVIYTVDVTADSSCALLRDVERKLGWTL